MPYNRMNMRRDNIYAIILAAGQSSRLSHHPKQLLKWQGQSLLEHTLNKAQTVLNKRVFVVLGAHHERITANIKLNDVTTVLNSAWDLGISSSIRAGVSALPPEAHGVIILLSDQPLIQTDHLETLITRWYESPSKIIASEYHQSLGVPALFPAHLFIELQSLSGDKGAKALLTKHADHVIKIPLAEAELDIDTPEDFEYLLAQTPTKKQTLR